MQIAPNNYSIAELKEMMDRRDLTVNKSYQRGQGLWPQGARSYFIDTILTKFPFPKLYFYEYLDRETKKVRKEIVDGQQRISTLVDFSNDEFAVSGESKFKGLKFSGLEEDDRDAFLSYAVSVDVIRNADRGDILQLFRRMNAYTLPLNAAEKRHSSFSGAFKWSVNSLTDRYAKFLSEFGVLTSRQIVRMQDAELFAEIALTLEKGFFSSSDKTLSSFYRKNDLEFEWRETYENQVSSAIDFFIERFGDLRGSHIVKPYVLHMLIVALIVNKFGNQEIENLGYQKLGKFCKNSGNSLEALQQLAEAHETNDVAGSFAEYVWSCAAGTNRAQQRAKRFKFLFEALNG